MTAGTATLATGAPVAPPRAWFNDPGLNALTPLTVTPEGRVFGHLASWRSCHMQSQALGQSCVKAPKSRTGYAGFHTGYVTTAEGVDIPTGRIVAGAPHADPVWGLDSSLVHYSHSGWAGADVRVGEDKFGIWVAGAVRPDVTPAQLRALKGSPLSGDWRVDPSSGQLELVAALAVNSPGFSIPRPTALVASTGAVNSMIAVGIVQRLSSPREYAGRVMRLRADSVRLAGSGIPKPTVADAVRRMDSLHAARPVALIASMTAPGANVLPWSGVLGFEGVTTGDGRVIDPGALTAARFPMPLRWAPVDMGGHDGAVIVGTINEAQRGTGGQITGSGVIDLGSDDGREAARMIAGGFLSGVSFDLDSTDQEQMMSAVKDEEDGPSPIAVVQSGRIRGATLVALPAFDEARIELAAPYDPEPDESGAEDSGDSEDSGSEDSGDDSGEPADCGCSDTLAVVTESPQGAKQTAPTRKPTRRPTPPRR